MRGGECVFERVTRRLPEGYLVVALLISAVFCLEKPPFFTPDEANHVDRVLELARGEWVGRVVEGQAGSEVDANVLRVGVGFGTLEAKAQERKALEHGAADGLLTDAEMEPLRGVRLARRAEFVKFQNTSIYPPELYVPAIVGWRLGAWRDLTIVHTMLLARTLAALCAVGLGWLAMRLAGRERWLVFAGLLLPSVQNLSVSCSQDALLLPLTALALVLVARAVGERRAMTGWELAGAAAALAMVADAKPPFLLLAVVLFLPALDGIGTGWGRLVGPALGVALMLLVVGHWQREVRPLGMLRGVGSDPALQMRFLWAHPLAGVATLGRSSLIQVPVMTLKGLAIFGAENDVFPPKALYGLLALCVAGMVWLSPGRGLVTVRAKVVLVVTVWAVTVGICLAEYLVWTPVGGLGTVGGLQARYFLPLGLMVLFLKRRDESAAAASRERWLLGTAVVFLGVVLSMPWVLAHRFYGTGLSVAVGYGLK